MADPADHVWLAALASDWPGACDAALLAQVQRWAHERGAASDASRPDHPLSSGGAPARGLGRPGGAGRGPPLLGT